VLIRRKLPLFLAVLLAGAVALTGCRGHGGAAGPATGPSASSSAKIASATVSMTPAADSADIAPATPVAVSVTDGTLASVTVTSGKDTVAGALSADGTSWTSKGKLAFGSMYTVSAALTSGGSKTVGTFSTAAQPAPSQTVHVSSTVGDHQIYGMAMPVILHLDRGLTDKSARAELEEAMTVKTVPATVGAWGWINSRELHFRPQRFWAAGTKIHVSVDAAGRRLGDLWGRTDLTLDYSIGVNRELRADAVTHMMTVVERNKVVRKFPISLGKPSRPSSSGILMIMDKRPKALFDSSTYGLPVNSPEGYRTVVQYAMRLTWGGEFIHSAPWSVRQQGHVNVSHGCINVAPVNAAWLFNRVRMGDPVVVSRTGTPIQVGNGWSDWSVSYAAWAARSATGSHPTA
jgi:lipoprotein-anchoring transpeptidase ErfK/SrfK